MSLHVDHDARRGATSVDRRLGQRVRARRFEIGMSQEKLAELLGVTFQQVQKYEKGVNRIAASRLVDMADALGLPAARFLDGLGRVKGAGAAEGEASALEATLADAFGAQIARDFARLKTPRLRRAAARLVAELAEAQELEERS